MYFPASWSFHAIVFEIIKEDDNHVTFKIFNSGDGTGTYHAATVVGIEKKIFPYVARKNIPIKRLTSLIMLKALTEVYAPKGASTKPDIFYERFMPMLGGVVQETEFSVDEFRLPQQAGTCSYASLPWIMNACSIKRPTAKTRDMSRENDRLEHAISLLTMRDYAVLFGADLALKLDDESRNLFRKSLHHFSAATADVYNQFSLSEGETRVIVDKLKTAQKDIRDAESLASEEAKQNAPQFSARSPVSLSSPKVAALPLDQLGSSKELLEPPQDVRPAPIKLWDNTITAMDKDYYQRLKSLVPEERFFEILDGIEAMSQTLSLRKAKWPQLSSDQAAESIELLSKFAELYLFALIKGISKELLPADSLASHQWLCLVKLLATADFINTNYVTSKKPVPSLYSSTWGDLLFKDLANVVIESISWQEQYAELKNYFENAPRDKDFFGFDKLPAGANYSRRLPDDVNVYSSLFKQKTNLKRWEDSSFRDDDRWWAEELITSHKNDPAYDAWLAYAKAHEQVEPYTFRWEPAEPADVIIDHPKERNSDQMLELRASIKLIAGRPLDENGEFLAKERAVFANLRKLAMAANFVFTGSLSNSGWTNMNLWDPLESTCRHASLSIL